MEDAPNDPEPEPEPVNENTPSAQNKFEWGTASKMIEWTLLLFTLLFITSRIIKGVPPSDFPALIKLGEIVFITL